MKFQKLQIEGKPAVYFSIIGWCLKCRMSRWLFDPLLITETLAERLLFVRISGSLFWCTSLRFGRSKCSLRISGCGCSNCCFLFISCCTFSATLLPPLAGTCCATPPDCTDRPEFLLRLRIVELVLLLMFSRGSAGDAWLTFGDGCDRILLLKKLFPVNSCSLGV